jgi:hypothetical protein
MNRNISILVTLCVVGFFGYIAYLTVSGKSYRVKVCMAFQGRNACKTVKAKTEPDAVRGAVTNACGDIAAGVTEVVACENTAPASITWLSKGQ